MRGRAGTGAVVELPATTPPSPRPVARDAHDVLNVRPPAGTRPLSVGRIAVVGAVALGLAALLNSETLLEMAERQPFGGRRDFYVSVAEQVHDAARALRLDRPGEAVDEARGRNDDTGNGIDLIAGATSTTAPGDDVAPTTVAGPPGTAAPMSDPGASDTTLAATTTLAGLLRTPTAAAPLKLYIGGDSMVHDFGQALERQAGATGIITPTLDYRISTGLTRPDYFDWPAHLVEVVEQQQPEVMVVMFGANDAQNMKLDGVVVGVSDQAWQDEYRARVAAVMDYLGRDGRRVVWVGQPVMRSAGFAAKMEILNQIYSSEAAERPGVVTYLDSWPLFVNANGVYSDYLDVGGKRVLMRQGDGIHLSISGADRLAEAALGAVAALWGG